MAYGMLLRQQPFFMTTNSCFNWNGLYVSIESRSSSKGLVLFVHGGPGGNSALFQEATRRIPVYREFQYGWIFYDQRGCGRSNPASPNTLSHEANLTDLKNLYTFLTEKENLPVHAILGHSYGAWLTYEMAFRHQLVHPKLIFLGFGEDIKGPRNRSLLMDLILLKMRAPERYKDLLKEFSASENAPWKMAKQVRQALGDPQGRKHFYWANLDAFLWSERIRQEINLPDNNEVFAIVRKTLYQDEQALAGPFFEKLKTAYLRLVGFHDFLMAGEGCDVSSATVFPASGHYPHLEEPERFVRVIESFLEA